jgi:putative phosphoesterase
MHSDQSCRIAVFADIHGNLQALEAVLDDMDHTAPACDVIFVAGDVLSLGPQPEECINLLKRRLAVSFVMGNNDRYVDKRLFEKSTTFHTDIFASIPDGLLDNLRWTRERLSKGNLSFLHAWPMSVEIDLGGKRLCLAHGTPQSDEETVTKLFDNAAFLSRCERYDCCIFGHTHVPCVQKVRNTLFVNPGSVGDPLDGDPRASYAVIDIAGGALDARTRRVAYDSNRTFEKMRELSVPWSEKIIEVMKIALLKL